MPPAPAARRTLAVLVIAVSLACGAASAPPAGATILPFLTTYPVETNVDILLTEKATWQGIRAGCYAPAENFSIEYDMKMRTQQISRVRPGTATLTAAGAGATATYGSDRSFRQYMGSAPWDIKLQDSPPCPAATAPPAWALAPICNRIEEKVAASLIEHNDIQEVKPGDGALVITRTPVPHLGNGASIGERCIRALPGIDATGIDSEIALGLNSTLISIPVPNLRAKLKKLAKGKRKAQPSFSFKVNVGGDCTAMSMSPSTGLEKPFDKAPWPTFPKALGNPDDLSRAATCMISGGGKVTVTRVGPVERTGGLMKGLKLPPGVTLP